LWFDALGRLRQVETVHDPSGALVVICLRQRLSILKKSKKKPASSSGTTRWPNFKDLANE